MSKTYEELLDEVLEAVEMREISDDIDDDIMEEGANSRLRDIKSQAKSLKKINIKGMKQMYKSGDYAGAKKAGKDILEAIEDYEEQFREVDQSFGNALLGDLMGGALRLIKDLALGIITFGIGPLISFSKRMLSQVIHLQKTAGNKDVDYKLFNSYANDILTMLDDMKHQVKALMAKCDEGLKATGGATQESGYTDIDLKLVVYESAYSGEITEEERDELLSVVSGEIGDSDQ